jgi:hypothetical protein
MKLEGFVIVVTAHGYRWQDSLLYIACWRLDSREKKGDEVRTMSRTEGICPVNGGRGTKTGASKACIQLVLFERELASQRGSSLYAVLLLESIVCMEQSHS